LFGGRKAFEGDSFGATLYKILEEVPEPLLNLDATLPPAVIAIIERALEKARDDRYPSMSEMLRDLSLYRQQYLLANTPPLGAPSDVTRVPSDLPRRSVVGPLSPSSGTPAQPPMLAHDAPTIAAPTPVPVGNPGSGNRPVTAMSPDAGSGSFTASPSRTRTLVATVIGVSVLVVALAVWGFLKNSGSDTRPEANPAAAPSAQETQQAIASRLEQASKALQSGDQAEAERQADAVLAISPGHPEASALRDRARQATDTVQRGLASARELMTSGRFEEASRAAGEVLSVDPNNEEAKNLINDAATRSSGRGVEQARQRMTTSKNAAIAAAASKLAAAPYGAALAAEREAQSLYKQEKMAEAVVKFSEATGLFRSAEIAAHTEAAARKERARAEASKPAPPAESEKTPEPKPEPIAPPLPTTPVPPVAGAGTLPKSSSVAVPQPPPSAPPPPAPQPAPAEARPAPSATALITEVLEQYESALERRDLAALKRVWPSLGGTQEAAIRSDFRNSKRIEVEIVSPQIAVGDDTATVRFLRRYTFDSVEGPTYQSQSNTTMTLQRNGNTWAITQIQYVPVR
jgi:tetratricopeptide (TPR) repeat protein